MKIVVTTPTGNTGSKVAGILLDRNADVTVIARHPEKVQQLSGRGAHVIAGEHDDPAVLEKAVRGADALYWVTPPFYTSHDPIGDARRFAEAAASVIKKQPDLHVVQLSSAGAFLSSGTGLIVGLHDTEQRLRAAGKNVMSLRANYFMENTLSSLPTISAEGKIYSSVPGSQQLPHIATQDIAEIAADVLLSPPEGHRIIDIAGPEVLSLGQVAELLGQAIGKTVNHVTIPGDRLMHAMAQAGISPEVADLFVEMEDAMPNIANEFRGDEKRLGRITFRQFAHDVFVPAYKHAAKSAA